MVMEPPVSIVSELGAAVACAASTVVTSMFWFAVSTAPVAAYSVLASGRRMATVLVAAAAASPVANEVPRPEALASMMAHGTIPLVAVPVRRSGR